jgi:uncharacterized protein YecE (DUF72 family)
MAIRIGCGSWADKEYEGLLYPKKTPSAERPGHYAKHFERIELNASYHSIPSAATMAGWASQTPDGFFFDVKLHRRFCEAPHSAAESDLMGRTIESIQPLLVAKKLGAFLLTLPPSFGPGSRKLEEVDLVAEKLRPYAPLAVELRDRRWVKDEALDSTLAFFRQRELVWVALDLPRLDANPILPPIDEVTHPRMAYMRMHGRNPNYLKRGGDASERHNYQYSEEELTEIVGRIQKLAARATDVHVSANNHFNDYAPKTARRLRELLRQPVPPPLAKDSGSDPDDQMTLL